MKIYKKKIKRYLNGHYGRDEEQKQGPDILSDTGITNKYN